MRIERSMWQSLKSFFETIVRSKFFQNSLVLFLGTTVVNILNYIFHLILGRSVDPGAYGEIESLVSLLAIISVPAGTLTLIATKYAADMKAAENYQGTYLLSRHLTKKVLLYGVPLFIFIFLGTPLVKGFLNTDGYTPIFLVWGVMFFTFLSAATSGILTGWQKFTNTSLIGVLATILKLAVVLLFLQLGFTVSGVIGSYVLSTIFVYVANLFLLNRFFNHNEAKNEEGKAFELSDMRKYIAPAFYGTLSLAILGNVDMIFAKHHLGAEISGEYGALSVAAKTIFFVTSVLTTVLFAMSAEENKRKETSSFTFRLAVWLTVLVAGGSVMLFSLFPEVIISLLFGEKYLGVSHILPWFALAAGIYSVANLLLQYLLSLHESRITLFFLALTGLEILTLFFFGETFYAIICITIATQVIAALLGFWFVLKRKYYVKKDLGSYTSL